MPSLIDLRRRIRAVKNTQQITKAMKMVAASKLRRAQERIMNARPYAVQMQRVLGSVASRVDPSIHPLLVARDPRPESRTLVIVVTADKGLCGSFNTNAIKAGAVYVLDSAPTCTLGLVGRKGKEFFSRRGYDIMFEHVGIFQTLRFEDARAIAQAARDAFLDGTVDRVMLVYNEFRSVMTQRVVVDQLLPIARNEVAGGGPDTAPIVSGGDPRAQIDYLYEPEPQEIFNQLLPRYVEVQVYRALLESNAAFYAAQMTAMDTATKNSGEMIADLTLFMNKVRQAAITREIIEVVSGAEAL
ncbi:MAG TPA: ATP synthase F1 subunit gamma [Vicinamibacterales bacterium]|jgi:F-type H+-transporting ATPase subunit gamma|nr:ATP synthase F1 subunit gamma [Vicinamibacterales bacterium]